MLKLPTDDVQSLRRRLISPVDIWTWFGIFVGAVLWISVGKPLADPDIWWHVRAGELILDSGIPRTEPWAFTATDRPWVMTAWLSDLVLALSQRMGGWWAIVVVKLLLSLVLLVVLGRVVYRLAPPRLAVLVFVPTALVLTPFLSERPQLISLLFVVWLTNQCRKLLSGGAEPAWWYVPIGYLWANLHGMWILMPMALTVVALGVLIDEGPERMRRARRVIAVAGAVVIAAALTPIGPRLVYWPLVVRDAASDISEWQPTVLASKFGMLFLSVLLLWLVAVARSDDRTPRSEVLWVAATLVFAAQAGRNLAPAAILIGLFAAAALNRTYGAASRRSRPPLLPRATVPATLVAAMGACVLFAVPAGPVAAGAPFSLVQYLKDQPGTVRVLNSYNIGGFLTGFGAPEVSVAIDGRTDNYETDFVHEYLVGTSGGGSAAQKLIRRLSPDFAVLGKTSLLVKDLRSLGWSKVLVDGDYILLRPPNSQ